MSGPLHMEATDSAGNDADLTYDFEVFYPALG